MRKSLGLIGGVLGLLVTISAHAFIDRGAYGRGYGGYTYNNGWAAPGAVIGVPENTYYDGYGDGCALIQTCGGANGCVNNRVCH